MVLSLRDSKNECHLEMTQILSRLSEALRKSDVTIWPLLESVKIQIPISPLRISTDQFAVDMPKIFLQVARFSPQFEWEDPENLSRQIANEYLQEDNLSSKDGAPAVFCKKSESPAISARLHHGKEALESNGRIWRGGNLELQRGGRIIFREAGDIYLEILIVDTILKMSISKDIDLGARVDDLQRKMRRMAASLFFQMAAMMSAGTQRG